MTALFYKFISLLPVKKYSGDIPVISVTVKLSLFYILLYHYVVFSTFSQNIRCIGQQNPSATSYHLNAFYFYIFYLQRGRTDTGETCRALTSTMVLNRNEVVINASGRRDVPTLNYLTLSFKQADTRDWTPIDLTMPSSIAGHPTSH